MTYGPMTQRIKRNRGRWGEVMSSYGKGKTAYEDGEARGITSGTLVKKRSKSKDYAAQSPGKLDFFTKYLVAQDDRFNKMKEYKVANAGGFTFTEEEEAKRFPNSGEVPNNKDRTGPPTSDADFVGQIMSAISQVESSSGKNTNHKKVESGMYKNQTAMGEWAIMPGNIDPTLNSGGSKNKRDSWINFSKFKQLYPEIKADAKGIEFIKNNPDAQRLIVTHQVSKNLNKTGDPREVASIWFTGKRIKNAGKVKDSTGTTNLSYLKKFDNAMEPY